MPLTDPEFEFLDAYVSEAYTPEMTGPATQLLTRMGLRQSDLSWLLTAHYREARRRGRNPMGSLHIEPARCSWDSKEMVLAREQEIRTELEPSSEPPAGDPDPLATTSTPAGGPR
jgi:hypothetical protein